MPIPSSRSSSTTTTAITNTSNTSNTNTSSHIESEFVRASFFQTQELQQDNGSASQINKPTTTIAHKPDDNGTYNKQTDTGKDNVLQKFQDSNSNNNNDENEDELDQSTATCQDTMETSVDHHHDKTKIKKKNTRSLVLHARRGDEVREVNLTEKRVLPVSCARLYSGAKYVGTQKCASASYEVNVELLHVDMKESTMSGYLEIKGLTSEFPNLTTFFEAEIIGPKYSFQTRKWEADQKIDLLHWKRFPSFSPYIDIFNNDEFTFEQNDEDDFIYMRWKEKFLVPDHHVGTVYGASFDGFYYICYQRSTDIIKGFYFFKNHKDWFQELTLEYVPVREFVKYEFR